MTTHIIQEDTIQPLVSAITSARASSQPRLPHWKRLSTRLKLSKTALVVLLWNAVVGATYGIVFSGVLAVGFIEKPKNDPVQGLSFHPALYITLGVMMLISAVQFFLYPFSGLIADIWCGRQKIMVTSLLKIWFGYGLLIVLIFLLAFSTEKYEIHRGKNGPVLTDFQCIVIGLASIFFILGVSGFQANVVQFGLDQFLDAPSEKLSLFLHWFIWTDSVGQAAMRILASLIPCFDGKNPNPMLIVITYTPVFMFALLTILMAISCYKRKSFHSEPRTQNPYGTVYKVLKFVAKHDKPLRRSAFAYCDDEMPTRIEFAKQRFGGPFSTETVEDVRTFLRMIVLLVSIGPVYIVLVATWYIFPLHGIYTGKEGLFDYKKHEHNKTFSCKGFNWVILASGNASLLVSVIFIPIYVIFILPCITKRLPKVLFRIGIGMALLLLADLSMTLTQLGGYYYQRHMNDRRSDNTTCLFDADYRQLEKQEIHTLGLPAWILLIPNILIGLAMPTINISILEFISAQSPYSMKGVLLGAFYAVRALFIVISGVLVFPFANQKFWVSRNGDVFDCGLSYYTVNTLLGAVGLGLFMAAAHWYRYRVRDDQPYGPHYAERYYGQQQEETADHEPQRTFAADTSILNYGTLVGTGI